MRDSIKIAVKGWLVLFQFRFRSCLYHPTSRSMWASVWEEGHVAVGPLVVYFFIDDEYKGLPGLGVHGFAYTRRGN